MKRPVVLIVGAVAGALILAAVGASAHTGLFGTKSAGVQSALSNDEASGARVEPTETPETETPEPAETPEAADTDTDENDDDQGEDNNHQGAAATGEHESDHGGSGTGSTTGGGRDD